MLTAAGQQRLEALLALEIRLAEGWKAQDIEQISGLQAEMDERSQLAESDLRPEVSQSLALCDAAPPLRLSFADEALRIRAEGGLDLRLQLEGDTLSIQGRRRPRFDLYEYLSTRLHADGREESVAESAEGRVERRGT